MVVTAKKKVLEFRLSPTGKVGSQFGGDSKKKSLRISAKSNPHSGEPVSFSQEK